MVNNGLEEVSIFWYLNNFDIYSGITFQNCKNEEDVGAVNLTDTMNCLIDHCIFIK